MNPIARLCPAWIRKRAETLRSGACDVRKAYTADGITPWTERVASAYEEAADVLDAAAAAMDVDLRSGNEP